MIDAALQGLFELFHPDVLLLMVVGIFIGVVVGFLPGIGGNFLLAVLIPFTFGMEPLKGLAFLLSAHAVIGTGSAISAILFNTPGSGNSAATVVDGYPMAQQGLGGRAVGASLSASGIGGLIGAAGLLLIIPVMRPVVLAFGPPEFFMLTMLGIAFISLMGGRSMTKGLFAGGLGLLLSTVGMDPQTGVVRFGFGSLYLMDGIHLVPVVIGLFAVSEMIAMGARAGGSIASEDVGKVGGVWQGLLDTFRHFGLTVRASLLGLFIGFLPGLGGDAAGWFAYGHAVQSSKTPERFGKGAVEGVIGPEAANNSKEGGALIPTVGFGVPGSSGMAILLGAFVILGVTPGPEMLSENLHVTFSMAWTLVLANVVGVVFGLILTNPLARLTHLRLAFIVPVIMAFATLGAFTTTNHIGDLIVALTFGIVGYGMSKYKYAKAPLILGLVLGQLAEVNLHISTNLYGVGFLLRPITMVIMVGVILTLATPSIKRLRANRAAAKGASKA